MKTINDAVAELRQTINSTLSNLQEERAKVAAQLVELTKAIAALEELTPPPRPKRKYQRRKEHKERKRPTPRVTKPAGSDIDIDVQVKDSARCGRGDCTHLELQHNKGPDKKCSAVGCWCYGFVRRAA